MKKLLTPVLALMLCMGMAVGAQAFVECAHTPSGEYVPDEALKCNGCSQPLVAKVNDTYYTDGKNAINAWIENGGTLTLLQDVTINGKVEQIEGKIYTFESSEDENGNTYTLSVEALITAGICDFRSGNLCLYDEMQINGDTTISANVSLTFEDLNYGGIWYKRNGRLTLESRDSYEGIDLYAFEIPVQIGKNLFVPEGFVMTPYGKEEPIFIADYWFNIIKHNSHTYKDGMCGCGAICAHAHVTAGQCDECGMVCVHADVNDNGECLNCSAKFVAKMSTGNQSCYYSTLTEALENAEGRTATIVMLADLTYDQQIRVSNGTLTIDLNQKKLTLTYRSNDFSDPVEVVAGNLTITNGSIESASSNPIVVSSDGVLTVENCSITGTTQCAVHLNTMSAQVIIKNSTLTGVDEALSLNGTAVLEGNVVLNATGTDSLTAQICLNESAKVLNLSKATAAQYTVRKTGYSDMTSLDLKNTNYEFLNEDGNIVSSDTPLKTGTIGLVRRKHAHNWTYVADEAADTITATCTAVGCNVADASVKAYLGDQEFVYDGAAKLVAPLYSVEDVLTANVTCSGDQVNAGSFTATLTMGGQSVSKVYTIAPVDLTGNGTEEVGDFAPMTYTGMPQTPVATVTYGGQQLQGAWSAVTNVGEKTTFVTEGNYTVTLAARDPGMKKAVPTAEAVALTLPENLYDTGEKKAAAVAAAAGVNGLGAITVKYQDAQGVISADAPSAKGAYTVLVDIAEGSNYLAVTGLNVGEMTIAEAVIPEMPQTGDNSRLGLWLMLMGMAFAGVITLRKRAHN